MSRNICDTFFLPDIKSKIMVIITASMSNISDIACPVQSHHKTHVNCHFENLWKQVALTVSLNKQRLRQHWSPESNHIFSFVCYFLINFAMLYCTYSFGYLEIEDHLVVSRRCLVDTTGGKADKLFKHSCSTWVRHIRIFESFHVQVIKNGPSNKQVSICPTKCIWIPVNGELSVFKEGYESHEIRSITDMGNDTIVPNLYFLKGSPRIFL